MRITKENLTRYDKHLKSWHRDKLAHRSTLELWRQTEEAGAVAFYPVGGSPLDGKVKFSFTETPPVSGDKGPSNPSTITGVSSLNVGRIGKNLLFSAQGTSSYYTLTRNSDGTLTVSGSGAILVAVADCGAGTGGPYSAYRLNLNKQYTLSVEVVSGTISNAQINLAQSSASQKVVVIPSSGKASISFTPSTSNFVDGRFVCRLLTNASSEATNAVLKIQLEEGDTATDFEAPMLPADANNSISLGSTYYGGEIDLATGLMTVTHGVKILGDTNISWSFGTYTNHRDFYVSTDFLVGRKSGNLAGAVCSHFNRLYSSSADTIGFGLYNQSKGVYFYYGEDNTVTKEEFNSFLASEYANGTPVTIVYELETPQTVQLSPVQLTALAQTSRHEPRLNTVYTDADSVQITYQKSPIRAATEQEMAILGLGGNI